MRSGDRAIVVSICIPTYNAARYLPTAIERVLGQDFVDFEIVICDDGSTDDTAAVCAGYKDPRIRYLRFENGGGQATNFNRCLKEARGEFVTLLHADDYYLPGFLTQRIGVLRADPTLVLATGGVRHVNDAGESQGTAITWTEDRIFPDGAFVRELLMACIVVPVSMVFRRAAALRAGPFRPDIVWGPDWEWVLRLAALGGVHYSAAPLAAYRVHAGSGTATAIARGLNGPNERTVLREAFARLVQDARFTADLPALKRRAHWQRGLRHMSFAESALQDGRGALARANARWALRAAPALATRPTFWALILGSYLPPGVFNTYRKLRPQRGGDSSAVQLS